MRGRTLGGRGIAPMAGALLIVANLIAHLSAGQAPASQPPRDWTRLNVCQLVPGDAVARAVGATLNEARPFYDKGFSRCTYLVTLKSTNKPAGYVVWMQPEADFEGLKAFTESLLTPVQGLGDGAYSFEDKEYSRFKIRVLKRGDLMFEATGDSAASARKVADVVVAHLWKKAPAP
jgi:hypothetical protein